MKAETDPSALGHSETKDRRLLARTIVVVFVLTALVFSVSPVITNYDSFSAFPTAVSIVNRHTLSLTHYQHVKVVTTNYGVGHSNGTLLTYFPWAVALFAVPAVLVLDLLHALGGPSADAIVANHPQIGSLVQLWSASLVTALACAVLALLAYRRLGGTARTRRRLAFLCGLGVAFGTSAWSTASRSLWQHGPSMLLLALGLLALDKMLAREAAGTAAVKSMPALAAGLAFMAAVAVRPTNAIALVLGLAVVLWKARRSIGIYIVGALVVAVPWIIVTDATYGSLVQPYDQASRLGLPSTFLEALAANVISPGRGLIIFSPVVLIAAAGVAIAYRRRFLGALELMSIAAVRAYLVVVSLYPVWWAGNSYGPRYMSETLPFLFVLALPFVDWMRAWHQEKTVRRPTSYRLAVPLLVVVLALSVLVNAQGGVLRASSCWNLKSGTVKNVDQQPSRVWSWANPQFDYALRALGSEGLHAITACPAPA